MALERFDRERDQFHDGSAAIEDRMDSTLSAVSSGRSLRALASTVDPTPASSSRSRGLRKLSTRPDQIGRPGVIRRPSFATDPFLMEQSDAGGEAAELDLSALPPPEIEALDSRSAGEGGRRTQRERNAILDARSPGKVRTDSSFLLPLLPALALCALSTYVWFQSGIRLESYLPLVPVLMGVGVGGIMRLGTRSVDFARVIFAVIITGFATLWGHAAMLDMGPLGPMTTERLAWRTMPQVANPVAILGQFHDTAERNLAAGTLMFMGVVAAGLVSSLTAKRD